MNPSNVTPNGGGTTTEMERVILEWVPLAPLWLVVASCLVVVLIHSFVNLRALQWRWRQEEGKHLRRLALLRVKLQEAQQEKPLGSNGDQEDDPRPRAGEVGAVADSPRPWYSRLGKRLSVVGLLSTDESAAAPTVGSRMGRSGAPSSERTSLLSAQSVVSPNSSSQYGHFPNATVSFGGMNSSIASRDEGGGPAAGATRTSPMTVLPPRMPGTSPSIATGHFSPLPPPMIGIAAGGEIGASRISSDHAVLVSERQEFINAILHGNPTSGTSPGVGWEEELEQTESAGLLRFYTGLPLQLGVLKSLVTLTLIFYVLPQQGGWRRYSIFSLCNVAMGQWNFLLVYFANRFIFKAVEIQNSTTEGPVAELRSPSTSTSSPAVGASTSRRGSDAFAVATDNKQGFLSRCWVMFLAVPGIRSLVSVTEVDSWDLLTSLGSILDIEDVRTATIQAIAFILVCVAFTPFVITHLVPGLVLYGWLYLPVVLGSLWLKRLYYRRRLVGQLLLLDKSIRGTGAGEEEEDERLLIVKGGGTKLSSTLSSAKIAAELILVKTVGLILLVLVMQLAVSQASLAYDVRDSEGNSLVSAKKGEEKDEKKDNGSKGSRLSVVVSDNVVRAPSSIEKEFTIKQDHHHFHVARPSTTTTHISLHLLPTQAEYFAILANSLTSLRSDRGIFLPPTPSNGSSCGTTVAPIHKGKFSSSEAVQGVQQLKGKNQKIVANAQELCASEGSTPNSRKKYEGKRILAWTGLIGMFLP